MLQGRSASKLCSSPVMNKETIPDASWLLLSSRRSCVMSSAGPCFAGVFLVGKGW